MHQPGNLSFLLRGGFQNQGKPLHLTHLLFLDSTATPISYHFAEHLNTYLLHSQIQLRQSINSAHWKHDEHKGNKLLEYPVNNTL